ncbi:MAG: UDP-3-O-(3-hydroxymyristoyl)glucosamine N-acyltransferase [Rickettsiales bacterium]|jgi:UDP-3-O-[3-hydroxymyristoyl] glucosamine N-acyltransferase|nr:UDP-3-O-(3-hydroxymyristoyl)glucosamine N-acyltransferase [Rickettsiales bacterium]
MQEILQLDNGAEEMEVFNGFFRRRHKYITLGKITDFLAVENIDLLNRDSMIFNLKTLDTAGESEITFFMNPKYTKNLKTTEAEYCLINKDNISRAPEKLKLVIVQDVHYAYAKILDYLYSVPQFFLKASVAAGAWVDPSAEIGSDVEIQHGAYIGERVKIGNGCKICANAIIGHNCQIGDGTYIGPNSTLLYSRVGRNVVVQSGANIGQCGFGFAPRIDCNYKIPHVGLVLIGDGVEIGAGSSIDRGVLEDTVIGQNTKIDNLIQIAHGVKIGANCFLAAQVGIAGGTSVGDYVQMGGKVGIAGHLKIGSRVKIAAYSGVTKDIEDDAAVGGYPAMPIGDWKKSTVILKKLIRR